MSWSDGCSIIGLVFLDPVIWLLRIASWWLFHYELVISGSGHMVVSDPVCNACLWWIGSVLDWWLFHYELGISGSGHRAALAHVCNDGQGWNTPTFDSSKSWIWRQYLPLHYRWFGMLISSQLSIVVVGIRVVGYFMDMIISGLRCSLRLSIKNKTSFECLQAARSWGLRYCGMLIIVCLDHCSSSSQSWICDGLFHMVLLRIRWGYW